MLKAIIVDDEQHCVDRIANLLNEYNGVMDLVATCHNLEEAKTKIKLERPDVVFLDVHLHNDTGFDLLRQLSRIDFEIVFTTAYDKYAVEAFKFSALDYLLKPVDSSDFEGTVQKLVKKTDLEDTSRKLDALFHNFGNQMMQSKKVAIPTLDGLTLIRADEIVRFQSEGNYTDIFLNSARKITATKTLKHFEGLLGSEDFFRIHKSHYINISFIEKYIKGKGGYVLMKDGAHIEVAVRRKEEFLKKLMG